jgi:hypothetical protein
LKINTAFFKKRQLIRIFIDNKRILHYYLDTEVYVMMKKYKWLVIGLAALLLVTAVAINLPAKQLGAMSEECEDDGSCCEDENTCSCS